MLVGAIVMKRRGKQGIGHEEKVFLNPNLITQDKIPAQSSGGCHREQVRTTGSSPGSTRAPWKHPLQSGPDGTALELQGMSALA